MKIRMFIGLTCVFAALYGHAAHANIVINGKICDDHGKPIPTAPKPPSKPSTPSHGTPAPTPKPAAPTQTQSQSQTQQQLQQQAQTASSRSTSASKSSATIGNLSATGGAGGKGGTSRSSATGGKSQSASTATTGPSSSTAAGGDASGQSVNESSVYVEKRQTPPAFAGTVQPTASCRGAINGGASAPVAGISFGFSKKDDECDAREAAREFYEMGRPDLAIMVLCKTKVGRALGDECNAPPRVVVVTQAVTQDDIDLEVKKRQHEHGFPNVNK